MAPRVLVTGATGAVGRHLTRRLLEEGAEVRALCRDPARPLPDGAERVIGDLTDATSLHPALKGVDRAFVLLTDDAGAAFAQAVNDVGADSLDRLVLLSANAPDGPEHDNPLFRKHVLGEARMAASGVPTTVLHPGPFASLALGWAPAIRVSGVVRVVHPDLAVPVIDPRDIGDVAAVALLGSDRAPAGGTLPLSGPQRLDVRARVRTLGRVLGRTLRVERVGEDEWVRSVSGRLPEWYARALMGVERHLAEVEPAVVPTVRRVTGREARTFGEWAEDNAAAFRA
ncbi:SDR family oxidoreductase [Thermomonospora umbrina]|uniref:Uncharacterized protein YbjT (DUF2867 family) n=1 Tax=Thermomonospora umbrina TaxID=111806 RepID=A0A3D9SQK2_9ACTN|nr:NAD(P)H-binding protein [Thermomonospora umbrina]REE96253.1 uncharacterized protein YbjT (DUF2867 family) [Thermomonospora umbrina]